VQSSQGLGECKGPTRVACCLLGLDATGRAEMVDRDTSQGVLGGGMRWLWYSCELVCCLNR